MVDRERGKLRRIKKRRHGERSLPEVGRTAEKLFGAA